MTSAGGRSSAVLRELPASRRPHTRPGQLIEVPQAGAVNLDEARLHAPLVRPGSVPRTALVNRLRVSGSRPVVTVLAPAGYGKTTLLAQWADRDKRPFAWVSIEDGDDPGALVGCVAAALSRIEAIDSSALDSQGACSRSTRWATRWLSSALFSAEQPLVLVLDDVHLLSSREGTDVVKALVGHVPPGSTLVLSGRSAQELPLARLRSEGRLFELGADALALSRSEARLLLREEGVQLPKSDASRLVDRTEGWAAGLQLAALSIQDVAAPGQPGRFSGADRFVADYFRSEYLSHLRPGEVRFLTRTAVLETMSGPSCDAVLESKGSARKLQRLEESNLFMVPLDRSREFYRYHHLFRDLLLEELTQREPDLVHVLNRRAARWCEANGRPEAAVDHAEAAGDTDRVARLVGSLALPLYHSGRVATIEGWLERFDDDRRLARYPALSVHGAWVHAVRGRPAAAERWLRAAENGRLRGKLPDGSTSTRPWIALLRAAMCREGSEQMLSDAEAAVRELAAGSRWRPTALLVRGVAHLLLGSNDRADACMAEAADAAESVGATDTQAIALSERSLLAAERGDHAGAKVLGLEARALVDDGGLRDYPTSALGLAASARAELRTGSWERARLDLERADGLRPALTHAFPWFSVHTRLELARARMALLDIFETRSLLSEVEEILRRRPDLGVLAEQAVELREESDAALEAREGAASTLTPAELRLLPLLATHLSFREIGEGLRVSRNTVKTQAISAYRKLGVSSRSEAIQRAAELGLVDPPASPQDFILAG
jgi:LuxR family transcriptional regulator, maltose regulon positive regulatory protein